MPGIKSVLSFAGRAIAYILVILFAIGIIVGGFNKLFGPPVTPGNLPLAKVIGTLALQPEVHNNRGTRSSSIVKITLNEYPNRSFNI